MFFHLMTEPEQVKGIKIIIHLSRKQFEDNGHS